MEPERAMKLVEDLRNLATFIESNPRALPPGGVDVKATSYIYGDEANRDTFLTLVKMALASDMVDNIRKEYTEHYFEVHLAIGDIDYEAWAQRESVCEKRIVATETVIEKVPVEWEEKEIEKEIVEWDCHPLLKS